jgi:hypothetical protein
MPVIDYLESTDYLLPFDHTVSSTGLAVVNPDSFETITVTVTFRDEQGSQFYIDSFTRGPLAHSAFSLSERYPQSKGHRGVVELATKGSNDERAGTPFRRRLVYVRAAICALTIVHHTQVLPFRAQW